jgi:hypothetical protein
MISKSIFILITFLISGGLTIAQELTAEQVGRDSTGHTSTSKVYMGYGKVRIEPQDEATPGSARAGKSIILLDLAAGTSVVLDVDRKIYFEQSPAMAHRSIATYKPADNTPCEKNPRSTAASSCKKSGTEMINGRNTEKWELTTTMAGKPLTVYVWLDSQWHFIVKQETQGMSGELTNIKEAPQPLSLFEIPAGYQKMSMQDMSKQGAPH